jgi:hypothetical protein
LYVLRPKNPLLKVGVRKARAADWSRGRRRAPPRCIEPAVWRAN